MSEKARSSLLLPEQKLARRLIARRGLTPPIDVEAIAAEYAGIEHDIIPTDADAVLLYESAPDRRPLIIVARGRADVRVRFTLAHELGHIIIPWHVGELVYRQDRPWSEWQLSRYHSMEAEANRFASELLMPSLWVEALLATSTDLAQVVESIRTTAKVSIDAACWAVASQLPDNYLMVQVDEFGVTRRYKRASNSVVSLPPLDRDFDPTPYARLADLWTTTPYGGGEFHWIKLGDNAAPPASTGDSDSKTVLQSILAERVPDEDVRRKLYASISAVTGSQFGHSAGRTVTQVYTLFVHRFVGRDTEFLVIDHADFHRYLYLRAQELCAKRDGAR